jgi:pyrroloquinoline quinone biosynthesis protein D
VLVPDETALEILQRCNGTRQLTDIVDELANAYSADRNEIENDVRELLASLIEKRIVTA